MSPPPYSEFPSQSPRRPSGVTPIAILGIIFGALGILCIGCGGLMLTAQLNNPSLQQKLLLTHEQIVLQIFVSVIGLALSILLLSASIGALNLAAWSRSALIIYALCELVFEAYQCFYALTIGIEQATRRMQNPNLPPNPTPQQVQVAKAYAEGFRVGYIAVTLAMIGVMIAYSIWILIVMRRADVIAAFEGQPPQMPPGGYPPNYPPTSQPQRY